MHFFKKLVPFDSGHHLVCDDDLNEASGFQDLSDESECVFRARCNFYFMRLAEMEPELLSESLKNTHFIVDAQYIALIHLLPLKIDASAIFLSKREGEFLCKKNIVLCRYLLSRPKEVCLVIYRVNKSSQTKV